MHGNARKVVMRTADLVLFTLATGTTGTHHIDAKFFRCLPQPIHRCRGQNTRGEGEVWRRAWASGRDANEPMNTGSAQVSICPIAGDAQSAALDPGQFLPRLKVMGMSG